MSATVGIDLASQPTNTALCVVSWEAESAEVLALLHGVDGRGAPLRDELLVAAMRGSLAGLPAPSKVAIDSPLGWPVDLARGLAAPDDWPVGLDSDRSRLERRATDHWVRERTGKQPLSVATDRIAFPAMRAAGILAHLAREFGEPVDRSGMTGLVCEAYPDPAIREFGIWPASLRPRESYKRKARAARQAIVEELRAAASWLLMAEENWLRCADADDCLDALICALVARAAELGRTVPPPDAFAAEARAEGWIHIPERGCLALLV
jgi:hypothetical protein